MIFSYLRFAIPTQGRPGSASPFSQCGPDPPSPSFAHRQMPKLSVSRFKISVREPFSGISHLAGAALACVGVVDLIVAATGRPLQLVSFAVYGISLILMYLSSGIYHSVQSAGKSLETLRRIDHMAIYMLIAGTYVPICLIALHGPWGGAWWPWRPSWPVVGTVATFAFKGGPGWLRALLYVGMGWLAVVALRPLSANLAPAGMHWLFAGGVVYTVGAVVYVTNRPRLWPGRFGAHHLWHLFVIGGSYCHFVLIRWYLA